MDRIQADMYAAMKAKEKVRAGTLRTVLSALKDRRIEIRRDLTDQDVLQVLRTQVKQRSDSIEQYRRGQRPDLVEQEEQELAVIQAYLPQMMNEEDVKALVADVIRETGATSLADMRLVMPRILEKGAGRVDGKLASRLVREALSTGK
ncbi:MAG: GatB/YqeY domain-containing protein [Candidatus Neomarinimicrobiota bacterium]|nr:MAG: GatB/YqeY domain-containing protein [Candidatus Neomarinimicrobiota bacterium]